MYAFFDTILSILTNSDKYKILFFLMKILNKLADVDVLSCRCNHLKDRWLRWLMPDLSHANSHEKIGEWARC